MEQKFVFNRYAVSYFLSEKKEMISAKKSELTSFLKVYDNSNEMKKFFASPVFSKKEKYLFIENMKEKNIITKELSLFLKVIVKNGRGFYLRQILQETIDEANNILKVKNVICYSAMELSDKQKDKLTKTLEIRLKSMVSIHYLIDTTLIGGLKLFVDDHLIDGSVKTNNMTLKKQVIGGSNGN